MADYFGDHGAYASALGTTPTWGVPQEGDGSSKDAATAASIGSILFTSVPTSGTFGVCGASVSTSGVIGAANVDAAANALATRINDTLATVSSLAAVGTPQLRNLVFARGPVGGAPVGTCQIMMRIGSARLNTATNSNAAITSSFDGSPTVTQFAGGSGGCWGWFINPVALGVSSSIGAMTYGQFLYLPYVCYRQLPTVQDDYIHWRSGGGASKTISFSATGTTIWSKSATWRPHHLVDTNTIWTGDSPTGQLALLITQQNWNNNLSLRFASANFDSFALTARRRGGMRIGYLSNANTAGGMSIGHDTGCHNSQVLLRNVAFTDDGPSATVRLSFGIGTGEVERMTWLMHDCDYSRTTSQGTAPALIDFLPYNAGGMQEYVGCSFSYTLTGAGSPGPVISINGNSAARSEYRYRFSGCRWSGYAQGFPLYTGSFPQATSTNGMFVDVENCSGLKLPDAYWGIPTSTVLFGSHQVHRLLYSESNGGAFRYEHERGVWEWLPAASPAFPTLSALTPDGSLPWSIRHVWVDGTTFRGAPSVSPELRVVNRGAAAVKTCTVEISVPSALTFGYGDVIMQINYIDSSGVSRSQTAYAPVSSSATWTGALAGFTSRKFELTTDFVVPVGAEIAATISFNADPSNHTNATVYINPEVVLS